MWEHKFLIPMSAYDEIMEEKRKGLMETGTRDEVRKGER